MNLINSMPAILLLLLVGVFTKIPQGVESIGVAYGTLGDNLPRPSDVVNMYKSHNIARMRIYSPDPAILQALSGSNIELVMGINNDNLQSLVDPNVAGDWVFKNIMSYQGVSFRRIVVGNEVPGDKSPYVLPVMRNIQAALNNAKLNQIKVTTSISYGTVTGYPPSAGRFTASELHPIVQYLASIGSPLLVNIYPYFSYTKNNRDYALFTAPGTVVHDPKSNLNYKNLFDAMVDTVLFAMDQVLASHSAVSTVQDKVALNTSAKSTPNPGIVVSETGWPTRGGVGGRGDPASFKDAQTYTGWPTHGGVSGRGDQASIKDAQIYNQNLINHVKRGTPKRPGEVETFIFSMFNENEKKGPEIERNFGLFYPNQQPVYPITFN